MNKIIIIVLTMAALNYIVRCLPIVACRGVKPGKFLRSFLEYVPYAALGALLFPEILFSTGRIVTALAGGAVASAFILKKKNMLIAVFGAIFVVYILNMIRF